MPPLKVTEVITLKKINRNEYLISFIKQSKVEGKVGHLVKTCLQFNFQGVLPSRQLPK